MPSPTDLTAQWRERAEQQRELGAKIYAAFWSGVLIGSTPGNHAWNDHENTNLGA